jgi:holliday junction DNA helicase RuvA
MIVKIRGILETVREDQARVDVGGIVYGVLISPAVSERLVTTGRAGQEITLHTLHYIEGGVGMGSLIPRLVGFLTEADREFFSLLTSVPGLGVRKALRAMIIPAREIARAIELNDLLTLKRLPEIGNKTAQKIVMELKGKAMLYANLQGDEIAVAASPRPGLEEEYQVEAYEVLLQLQYSQDDARELVARTLKAHPEIKTSDTLIQEIFREQSGRKK